jgi:hypothetical protein
VATELGEVSVRLAVLTLVIILGKVLLFYNELKLTITFRGVGAKTAVMRCHISMASYECCPIVQFPVGASLKRRSKPFSRCNGVVSCCRCEKQLVMREAGVSAKSLKALNSRRAERLPVRRCKIDSLVEVESVIETCVVGLRESKDKLACSLVHRINVDTSLAEFVRGHQRHKLEKKIGLALEQLRDCLPHGILKGLGVGTGDAVPSLGSAKVLIVRRICVMILVVPAES